MYSEHFVKTQKKENSNSSNSEGSGEVIASSGEEVSKAVVPTVSSKKTQKVTFQCEHCGKQVSHQQALEQHILAKHGLHSDIKPEWALANSSGNSGASKGQETARERSEMEVDIITTEPRFTCQVCQLTFSDEASLQHHLSDGFVPQNVELSFDCANCNKVFSNERALKQHQNFCLSKV